MDSMALKISDNLLKIMVNQRGSARIDTLINALDNVSWGRYIQALMYLSNQKMVVIGTDIVKITDEGRDYHAKNLRKKKSLRLVPYTEEDLYLETEFEPVSTDKAGFALYHQGKAFARRVSKGKHRELDDSERKILSMMGYGSHTGIFARYYLGRLCNPENLTDYSSDDDVSPPVTTTNAGKLVPYKGKLQLSGLMFFTDTQKDYLFHEDEAFVRLLPGNTWRALNRSDREHLNKYGYKYASGGKIDSLIDLL